MCWLSTALSQVKLKKVLLALGFAFSSLTFIAPTPSKAEGGCPQGFYPVGGGYCRNIVCAQGYVGAARDNDQSAIEMLNKFGQSCNSEEYMMSLVMQSMAGGGRNAHMRRTIWGNQTLPMR